MTLPSAPQSTRPAPRRSRLMRFTTFALLFCLMPIFVFGATVAATGTVTVRVQESGPDGTNLWIPVPALLLDLALFAAPRLMPAEALEEVRGEMAPYREMLSTLAAELEAIPAGSVLVEVHDHGDHVQVSKDWRSFEVRVDADDAQVRVSVPARILRRGLDLLGS